VALVEGKPHRTRDEALALCRRIAVDRTYLDTAIELGMPGVIDQRNRPAPLAPICGGDIDTSPYPYACVYVDDDSELFVVVDIRRTLPDGSWPRVSEPFGDSEQAKARCTSMNEAWIAANRATAANTPAAA
jgi:hypothetical protein